MGDSRPHAHRAVKTSSEAGGCSAGGSPHPGPSAKRASADGPGEREKNQAASRDDGPSGEGTPERPKKKKKQANQSGDYCANQHHQHRPSSSTLPLDSGRLPQCLVDAVTAMAGSTASAIVIPLRGAQSVNMRRPGVQIVIDGRDQHVVLARYYSSVQTDEMNMRMWGER